MGRVTLDLPEQQHHNLKILALKSRSTIKELFLSRFPEVQDAQNNNSLRKAMAEFEKMRVKFKADRKGTPWREIAHDGHKW